MATAKQAVVKARGAAKTVTRKKAEQKNAPEHQRIQTAEGWKRMKQKERALAKTGKTKQKKG